MKTFNQETKDEIVAEIIKHRKADQIVQGIYGQYQDGKWKGCAVGCAIHSLNVRKDKNYITSDHSVYEIEFGIPRILAKLEDRIFEKLSVEESKIWPENFMSAVPVETDLSLVWPKFAVWLLADEIDGVRKFLKTNKQRKVLDRVVELYQLQIDGMVVDKQDWRDAAVAAVAADAYAAAAAAAAYAADAAAAAYAAYAADAAAYAAAAYAYAADAAADAAAYAADAYAADAAAAAAADAAADAADAYAAAAARKSHYTKCAAKLIDILKKS